MILAVFSIGSISALTYKNSIGKNFYQLKTSLEIIQEIQKVNFNLDRLILKSRFHFLEHYDPLIKDLRKIRELNKKLVKLMTLKNKKSDYFEKLKKVESLVQKKESQIEKFKSENSFYKNSERYLPVLLNEVFISSNSNYIKQNTKRLSTLLLNFITQSSVEEKKKLLELKNNMLDKTPARDKPKVSQAMRHLDIVIRAGTHIDSLIKDITSHEIDVALQDLSKQISIELVSNEKEATLFYYALALFCMFLIGLTTKFIVNLESIVNHRTKELMKAKDLAEEGVKAKAKFLATMSHEIRTPMNAVLSCTNLLLDNIENPENIRLLKTVQNSSDTLLTLINDILDFSKIESGKMDLEVEPFDLQENTKEIVDLLNSKASEKGCILMCQLDQTVPRWIRGDVTRYRQVLTNLIGNAVKFTDNKVQVSVQAKPVSEGKYEIEVSVKDNGIGIPEEAKAKLFQDFNQADSSTTRKFGGTGLGLAICKGIIDTMGGRIWAESELNKGSTFKFAIIAEKTKTRKSQKKVKLSEVNPNMAMEHPLKILMAEDNTVNQMVAKKLLAKLGYRVDIVANGLEAVDAVKTYEYDVVLMDQHMPELDGVEATRKIRQFAPAKLRIYALTASAFKEDRDRCFEAGMNGFLTKPININEIVTALSECAPNEKLEIQNKISKTI